MRKVIGSNPIAPTIKAKKAIPAGGFFSYQSDGAVPKRFKGTVLKTVSRLITEQEFESLLLRHLICIRTLYVHHYGFGVTIKLDKWNKIPEELEGK